MKRPKLSDRNADTAALFFMTKVVGFTIYPGQCNPLNRKLLGYVKKLNNDAIVN